MHWLLRDVRFGIRESVRRPGFTLLALIILGLGIGSATVMYSVIYNVLLNPFPYTDPRGMVDVVIQDTQQTRGGIRGPLIIPEFRALVDETNVFKEAVGTNTNGALFRTDYGTEQLVVAAVTPNTFHFLGVSPLIGRTITAEDTRPGAPPVGVLSYKAWIKYLNRDPGILGRSIVLDDKPINIIGVMPARFTWNVADVWTPDPVDRGDPDAMKKSFWLQARLKPGINLHQAEAELNVIAKRLAQQFPERYPKQFTVKVITVIDWVVGRFRGVLYTLFGAVSLLLLISCCNIANMLLARATSREREITIRAAVGATRLQILRQMLVESLMLALGGAVVGSLLAYWGTKALVQFIPTGTIPKETEIDLNGYVLCFSVVTAVITAVLFGIAPALYSARRDVAPGLSSAGKGTVSVGNSKVRNFLVVSEVALSLVLLCGAAVLMRSFMSMLNLDLGFDPHNIALTRFLLPNATPAHRGQFLEGIVQRTGALPGVVAAAEAFNVPPFGGINTDIDVLGKVHSERWSGLFQLCSDGYFRALNATLLRGRLMSVDDMKAARRIAVVNETLVRRYFGSDDAIGRVIRLSRLSRPPDRMADPSFEVVGIISDMKNQGIQDPPAPEAYVPASISTIGRGIVVRTSSDAKTIVNALRHEIRALDKTVVLFDTQTLNDLLRDHAYSRPRFSVLLVGVFATIGLILVGSGIYSVMSYTVARQTQDIGIRMALGADRKKVFAAVLKTTLSLIGIGIAVGAIGSFAANRIISSQLWTLNALDPVSLLAGAFVVVAFGLAACFFPALRATRVDPVVALRQE